MIDIMSLRGKANRILIVNLFRMVKWRVRNYFLYRSG